MISNVITIGRLLKALLFSSLFFLSLWPGAQTTNAEGADSRLATFDATTGILHIPSLPFDGGFIWADFLYESELSGSEEQVTLIATGPASSEESLVSLDLETGELKVPFIAIDGGADDARYALGLVIVSMSPQIELRIEGLHRHNLNFMEVPDHSIRRVISSNNGEYLGLSGYPRRNETFGLIYIIETPEGLAEVVLLMNPDGKVTSLVHGDVVILLDEEEEDASEIYVTDDVFGTMNRSATVFVALACEWKNSAPGDLAEALQQVCDSQLLSTLGFFQDDGLLNGVDNAVESMDECRTNGWAPACSEGFVAGLDAAEALFNAALQARIDAEAAANPPLPAVPFLIGNGTSADPWVISTPAQFNEIRHYLDAHFTLEADIDLGGNDPAGPFYNGGEGWEPIGSVAQPFTGGLDGNNRAITGLFINRPDTDYVGLFASMAAGYSEIDDLELDGVDVTGRDFTGGLAGDDSSGYANIRVVGVVTGRDNVGGVYGRSEGGLANSASRVTVTGVDYVGGSVGFLEGGAIDSYSSALGESVTGRNYVGGLAGYAVDSSINHGTSWGAITGDTHVGGAVGYLLRSSLANYEGIFVSVTGVTNTGGMVGSSIDSTIDGDTARSAPSATTAVIGHTNTGGFVGYVEAGFVSGSSEMVRIAGEVATGGFVGYNNGGAIQDSSSTSAVDGVDKTGGLVGDNAGTISNSNASGAVTGTTDTGALTGSDTGTVNGSAGTGTVNGV